MRVSNCRQISGICLACASHSTKGTCGTCSSRPADDLDTASAELNTPVLFLADGWDVESCLRQCDGKPLPPSFRSLLSDEGDRWPVRSAPAQCGRISSPPLVAVMGTRPRPLWASRCPSFPET